MGEDDGEYRFQQIENCVPTDLIRGHHFCRLMTLLDTWFPQINQISTSRSFEIAVYQSQTLSSADQPPPRQEPIAPQS